MFGRKRTQQSETRPCAQCGNALGELFLNGPIDHIDMTGKKYCSNKCFNIAFQTPRLAVKRTPDPTPTVIPYADKQLLVGKSSGGMYFEPGRCAYCGHVVLPSATQPDFCSSSCREKAIRPYLPDNFHISKNEDDAYRKVDDLIDETLAISSAEYIEEGLDQASGKSREDMVIHLLQKRLKAEQAFEQRKTDQEHRAIQEYTNRWQAQRDYVLDRDKEKIAERESIKQEREQAKLDEQLRRQREKEAERLRKDQEKARKQQEADAIKQAEEERWAPRPFKP